MYKKNQQYSERVNALILQIQSLSYQKNTKISDISNLNVELKRIEYETLQGISDKNIRTIVQSIAKEFSSLCEQIATKKSKNKISLFTKIIDNSQNSKNIKTSDIQAELNQMAEVLKQHRNNIDKALEISQRTNTDEKKSDKEMTVKLKAKDLKLFPTKESSNPKHEELLHELGAQKACYANYQGATGGGSSFICAEDDKSIYMMTNKHVAFNYNKENGEIIGTNDIKALEFEENSGITLIKTKNIQSFASNNVDMAILKIPKKDFKITKKLYIPKFSPDLIKNGELVISMGNSYGDGNVTAFGSVINNKEKMKDNISGNRINNFIGSKITSYPGNSGCPLFHCNATEDKDGKMRFDEFQIVGFP